MRKGTTPGSISIVFVLVTKTGAYSGQPVSKQYDFYGGIVLGCPHFLKTEP
jgi:hypothetical protein